MLWTIILVLLILWALGFGFAGAAVGDLIHILLVIALGSDMRPAFTLLTQVR